MVNLLYPENNAVISLQTMAQRAFLAKSDEYVRNKDWRKQVEGSQEYMTAPAPAYFSWTGDDLTATFELSATADFSELIYTTSNCTSCAVFNLFVDRTYYWRVGNSEIRAFHTANELPRFIYAEGAQNIRDLGGYSTVYGRRVKQGMLYRSAAFDGTGSIEAAGIRRMREDLGIRCDFDIRQYSEGGSRTESPLGADIRYVRTDRNPMDQFIFFLEDHQNCAFLIRFFGQKDIYPVCIRGNDGVCRTSTIAFFLLAVLGVSDEDILFDLNMTALHGDKRVSVWQDGIFEEHPLPGVVDGFFAVMNSHFYGNTLHESCSKLLRLFGVKEEELDAFREIMLEPAE